MMKKILCIKNIKWIVLVIIGIAYGVFYMHLYEEAIKPDIRYYDKGTRLENGGIEYEFNTKMYNPDELMNKFGIEDYQISCIHYDYDIKFIVVEKKMTKLEEEFIEDINSELNMKIYSKYWQTGMDIEVTELLNSDAGVGLSELKVGDSTSRYQVFTIASCNLCERLWNKAEKEEVYFEFAGNEIYNYVRRVKVLN